MVDTTWTNPASTTLDLSTDTLVTATHWQALVSNEYRLGGADGNTKTGNYGIGTTPSASISGDYRALQVGVGATLIHHGATLDDTFLASNAVWNSTNWIALLTGYGGRVTLGATSGTGFEVWLTTGSTAAGGAHTTLTQMLRITRTSNVVLGEQALLATGATAGFTYVPAMNGIPTGSADGYTGKVPLVVDQTNSRVYVNIGGTWKYAALT